MAAEKKNTALATVDTFQIVTGMEGLDKELLAELEDELRQLMDDRVKEARYRLAIQIEKMNGLSPIRKLNQGFSYVEEADGSVIKSIRQVKKGDELTVYVTDGLIQTSVEAVQNKTYEI